MSEQSILRTPQAISQELDISSATLRRWADEFADYLSTDANSAQGKSHRRYSGQDVETLRVIKELLNTGLNYEQVHQQLTLRFVAGAGRFTATPDFDGSDPAADFKIDGVTLPPDESKALVASGGESPAIAFLTHTLATLSDTQQSILNSQAANRELLGVLIQDNFNLKEENNRLRERILEIERSLVHVRQEDEWRRESLRQELDAKMGLVQQMAADAVRMAHEVEAPEIKAIKSKPGCLGALFGVGGDTQIVTVPRKRSRRESPAGAPPAQSQPYAASPAPSPPPAYPKPTAPPE
ncbi:MAG: MerR family transcriptional regulator [Chloroflexota bacterium]